MTPDNKPHSDRFFLGFDRDSDNGDALTLDPRTLLRHMMALGSSGSGKTVLSKILVEEFVRHGVPAICVDPQGDLCSLALAAANPDKLAAKGVDPALAAAFSDRADVVVFTPAARKGVALSADPLRIDVGSLKARERLHALSGIAAMLVSLLGYDLGGDEGDGLMAVFDKALNDYHRAGVYPASLADFSRLFMAMEDGEREGYERLVDGKAVKQACRRLARLDVGARRLLFHEGLPLSIDLLLGRGPGSGALPGKTRLSVIYLNTLHTQEDKEFFVAVLCEQLYSWMLKNPARSPQVLFYIDEVAPFIPPVRKPASKPSLSLLFKQARKYGVACVMATQNPGDVDYKAMAQFGTWAIGRLTTRQDIKKVQPTIKALDPTRVDSIVDGLPAHQPGEFALISPDNFEHTHKLQTRWLYTEHETLDDERIAELTDERWRARFDRLERERSGDARAATAATPTLAPPAAKEPAPRPEAPAAAPPPVAKKRAETSHDQEVDEQEVELERYEKQLARKIAQGSAEFAERCHIGTSKARQVLKSLAAAGLAGHFREGRRTMYFARSRGLRPDLGMTRKVQVLVPHVSREEAEAIGRSWESRRFLGVFGDDEELVDVTLEHKLVLRLKFREKVKQGLWKRMFGSSHEERIDSIYLHPRTLQVVVYDPDSGILLDDHVEEHASEVADFDGVCRQEERLPGEIRFDESEWHERAGDEAVKAEFRSRYEATPTGVEPVFMPVWCLRMRRAKKSGLHVVTMDALSGHGLDW